MLDKHKEELLRLFIKEKIKEILQRREQKKSDEHNETQDAKPSVDDDE